MDVTTLVQQHPSVVGGVDLPVTFPSGATIHPEVTPDLVKTAVCEMQIHAEMTVGQRAGALAAAAVAITADEEELQRVRRLIMDERGQLGHLELRLLDFGAAATSLPEWYVREFTPAARDLACDKLAKQQKVELVRLKGAILEAHQQRVAPTVGRDHKAYHEQEQVAQRAALAKAMRDTHRHMEILAALGMARPRAAI